MKRRYFSAALLSLLCAAGCSDEKAAPADGGTDLAAATATATSAIVINEVYPHGSDTLTDPDWVELKNTSSVAVDLSGYKVRDDKTTVTLPSGTTIAAGGYLMIYADDAPDGGATDRIHVAFKLGSQDEFYLLTPDGDKVDGVSWDSTTDPSGSSYGRLPDGTGKFIALTPTPSARNI